MKKERIMFEYMPSKNVGLLFLKSAPRKKIKEKSVAEE